ncbi:MAG: cupredoxin domain-containing protein [Acidimicrobiia bacterium]
MAAACSPGAARGAGPAAQTFDVHEVDTYAKGEDPLEEPVPGTGDALRAEFHQFIPYVYVAFVGDTVILTVNNGDGTIHNLAIPELGVETGPIDPEGGVATVESVADEAGSFIFQSTTAYNPDTGAGYPTEDSLRGMLLVLNR